MFENIKDPYHASLLHVFLVSFGLFRADMPSAVQMDASGVHTDLPEHFFLQRYREAYRLELAHFFECLQSGAPFRTTIDDGVAAQKLADAAAESHRTGQPVQL